MFEKGGLSSCLRQTTLPHKSCQTPFRMATVPYDLKRLRPLGKFSYACYRCGCEVRPTDSPPGRHETYEAVRYVRELFTNVAVSAEYIQADPVSDQELKPLIFHAVARVIAQHPALSTIFLDAQEGSKPYYARLPQIDLRECVVFATRKTEAEVTKENRDPEWDNLLEEYHNVRFDDRWGELPLWRLVILHQLDDRSRFVACFVYLHTIGDGNAGPTFHRALLAELSSISGKGPLEPLEPVVRSPDLPIPGSLESLHRLPLSPCYLLKMAWEDRFPSNSNKLWLGGPVSVPTRSRFLSCTLTAETTRKLLSVGRAHSVTLTAICHSLVALAIFANLPPDKTQLKSSIAFNLRRFLPSDVKERDVMGNYVSAPTLDLKRPASVSSITWAEAQRIKKALDEETGRNGKDASTACLRYVSNMHEYFESKFSKARDGTFCLTNLGTFKRRENDNGPWRTGRMIFSEGFDAAREAICISMITGEDNCLTVGLVWGQDVVEEQLMLNISETLRTMLHKTANEET